MDARKLAVIVADVGAAVHVGGEVERTVRVFDMPADMVDYLDKIRGEYTTISIAALAKDGE